jgi:hypothetical protein
VLYRYSAQTHHYSYLGTLLTGVANSPYMNGLDFRLGRLHVSWCYRGFVAYEGLHNPGSTAHKAQVGPNGPENNSGLYYIYSEDGGKSWFNNRRRSIADLAGERDNTVAPDSEGIMVFDIPKGSGILNQESQTADWAGGFHVLNREHRRGREQWMHYYRDGDGEFSLLWP